MDMSQSFYVEVDKADLKYVTKKLQNAEKNAPRVLRNAINRTATQAMKMIRQGRSQGYTIAAGRFNSQVKKYPATPGRLEATIKSSGKTHTLKNFKTSMPKSGGKADITKSGLKKLSGSRGGAAFIPSSGKAAGLMVQRKGKSRFPLKVFSANSTPKMVEQIYKGERGGQGDMEDKVKKRLHEEIEKEIAKLI
jgi:hypothetical protein